MNSWIEENLLLTMTLDAGGVRVVGKIEMAHIVGGEREDELALPGRNTGISI